MTYNFDPDRWFENQRRVLDLRLERGEIDRVQHQEELNALEDRYDRMQARLDRPFELGEHPQAPDETGRE